jgi:hypothetical protein
MNRKSLLLVLTALSLQACATTHTYSAKPITATVVDAETGEPLEGVNVVAQWVLHDPWPTWGGAGALELIEAVTDRNGQFHIPGWEGKAVPKDRLPGTRLSNGDPEIIFFKSGYKSRQVGNYLQPERLRDENHTWERYSDWDDKIIKMEKFKGDLDLYTANTSGTLRGVGHRVECAWKKMPRFLVALMREKERLERLGQGYPYNTLPSMETIDREFGNSSNCGSVKGFFKEYMK